MDAAYRVARVAKLNSWGNEHDVDDAIGTYHMGQW